MSGIGITEAEDRGQLLVISGVVMAVSLVSVALVLNSGIFAGNLASRHGEKDTSAPLGQRAEVEGHLADSMRYVNLHNYSSQTTLEENLTDEVDEVEDIIQRGNAPNGRATTLSVNAFYHGRRIVQDDSRNFTAGNSINGQSNWTVIEDVTDAPRFQQTIGTHSMFQATYSTTMATVAATAYEIIITDSNGDVWEIAMYRKAGTNTMYLIVEGPEDAEYETDTTAAITAHLGDQCKHENETVFVDFASGEMGGSDCPPLNFFHGEERSGEEDLNPPYTITYNNTSPSTTVDLGIKTISYDRPTVRGTYRLLVDQTSLPSPDPYYAAGTKKSPRSPPALYKSDIRQTHNSTNVDYDATWTVRPSDPGRFTMGGNPPEITAFSVDDQSTVLTGADFDIDWTVEDTDGDMAQVYLYLLDADTNNTFDMVSEDVSNAGTSASGTLSVADSAGYDEKYYIKLEVVDKTGKTDTSSEHDTADGN